jgi:RNA polymerase sigma-70 factor (ECF subfamily)
MSTADVSHRQTLCELFELHYAWLCDRLRHYLDSRECVEDIASETFLQVLTSPNVVPIRQPRALLTTVAKRLMYERWRRRNLERHYLDALSREEGDDAPSPESLTAALQLLDRLDHRLNRLPAKVKTTFVLSRGSGMTYPEISQHLGISARSVSDYIDKAETCCLRACLE